MIQELSKQALRSTLGRCGGALGEFLGESSPWVGVRPVRAAFFSTQHLLYRESLTLVPRTGVGRWDCP